MEYFYDIEDKDGVRFSWNVWPSSRIDYGKLVVPLACLYSPMKKKPNMLSVFYNPLPCAKCSGILNPFCAVDFQSAKFWGCPFCTHKNSFPAHYQAISSTNLPAELLTEGTTIEYRQTPAATALSPVFLFVVDISHKHPTELAALKQSLLRALGEIPPDAHVGLITFGSMVQVYELPFKHMTKTVCFDGTRDFTPAEVQQMLNIGTPTANGGATPNPKNQFILPLSSVEDLLTGIFEELQLDPHPFNPKESPAVCTGVALSVALSLLQYTFPGSGARVLLITGAPATIGPGKVTDQAATKQDMRSHVHISKEETPFLSKAVAHYNALATRAVQQGHAVDIFSAALGDTGIMEMKALPRFTGGISISTESFTDDMFKESLYNFFEKDEDGQLKMGFNGQFEVVLSPELKVKGAIGHMASLAKKSNHVAESSIGIGETSSWRMNVLDKNSTFALYLDVVNAHNHIIPDGQYGMVQFRTSYQTSNGTKVLRVTTVAHTWSPPARGLAALVPSFDQEAAITLVAKMAIYKSECDEIQPRSWLDKHLIQLCATFGGFRKGDPASFKLPAEFSMYPEFIFHLRRGFLVTVSSFSPDETTHYRHYLLREPVQNCLNMILPSLDEYSLTSEPHPVQLSSKSLKPELVLFLDTFFHIVVHCGPTIAKWRNAGYHLQPEYENLKLLLEQPTEDSKNLLKSRFPVPKVVFADSGTSQARFLYAVLDPTDDNNQMVKTEDVPLAVFLNHLYKKAVSFEG